MSEFDDKKIVTSSYDTVNSPSQTKASGAKDPTTFDYRRYERRNQDFGEMVGSKKIFSRIPVRKPDKTWWVRVHPEVQAELGLYNNEAGGVWYLVDPSGHALFSGNLCWTILYLSITSQGLVFFWPVKSNGISRKNSWTESALEAISAARRGWVRIVANQEAQGYDAYVPNSQLADPEWDEDDINTLLERAFSGRIIDDPDHPIIRHLQGRFA
jgi:hypothetical protein